MPVGPTGFGFTLGSTASVNINQRESTTGTPAKTDGGAGFGQRGLDDQSVFSDANLVEKIPFDTEQVAKTVRANWVWGVSTHEVSVNGDPSFTPDGHPVQAELNPWLSNPIEHEPVLQIAGNKTIESEIGNDGTFIDDRTIGVPYLDFGLQSTPPGGNGSVSDLEFFDLQKLSLLSLQPGANPLQVPGMKNIKLVLPIVNVTAPLAQSKNQQNHVRLSMNPP
jgi:hypothetical protein